MTKLDAEQLSFLHDSLQDLEYGQILITVHDGFITQIDTTEKKRFFKQTNATKKRHVKTT